MPQYILMECVRKVVGRSGGAMCCYRSNKGTEYYNHDMVVSAVETDTQDIVTRVDSREDKVVLVKTYSNKDGSTIKTTIVRPTVEKIIGKVLEAYTPYTEDERSTMIPQVTALIAAKDQPFGLILKYADNFSSGYDLTARANIRSCMEGNNVDFYDGSPSFRLMLIYDKHEELIGRCILAHTTETPMISPKTRASDPLGDPSEVGWHFIRVYLRGCFTFREYDKVKAELSVLLPHITTVESGWVQCVLPENRFLPYLDAAGDYYVHDAADEGDDVFVLYDTNKPQSMPTNRLMRRLDGQSTSGNRFYQDNLCSCNDCGAAIDEEECISINDCDVCQHCANNNYTIDVFNEYCSNDSALLIQPRRGQYREYIHQDMLPCTVDGDEYVYAVDGFDGDGVAALKSECLAVDGEMIYGITPEDVVEIAVWEYNHTRRSWEDTGTKQKMQKFNNDALPPSVVAVQGGGWLVMKGLRRRGTRLEGCVAAPFVDNHMIIRNGDDRELFMYCHYNGVYELAMRNTNGTADFVDPYWVSGSIGYAHKCRYQNVSLFLSKIEDGKYNVTQTCNITDSAGIHLGAGDVVHSSDRFMSMYVVCSSSENYSTLNTLKRTLELWVYNGMTPALINQIVIDAVNHDLVYIVTNGCRRIVHVCSLLTDNVTEVTDADMPIGVRV